MFSAIFIIMHVAGIKRLLTKREGQTVKNYFGSRPGHIGGGGGVRGGGGEEQGLCILTKNQIFPSLA